MSRSKSGDGEPPQFDFQRFLDQMKTKSADPVAKYLRSYVTASHQLSIDTIVRSAIDS